MLPYELDIENFQCHSKSVIDFREFDSAVVVGKTNGNPKFSNGIGKSTIFSAIKYVLFNEVEASSMDKIIKNGKDSCKVSFKFQSSFDGQIYRIDRFRSRKTPAEVRLFKQVGDDWDDLTQRTSTETEKEIFKVLKINWKTFSNSILFAQGDVSGIAGMTPRDRKLALKEALNLGIYSKYAETIKKRRDELTREFDRTKTILSTIGEPEKDIISYEMQLATTLPSKKKAREQLSVVEAHLAKVQDELSSTKNSLDLLKEQSERADRERAALELSVSQLRRESDRFEAKVGQLREEETSSMVKAKALFFGLKEIRSAKNRDDDVVSADIKYIRDSLLECQAEYRSLSSTLKDLQVPLTEDSICKHCRQPVDPTARAKCQKSIDEEVVKVELRLSQLKKELAKLRETESSLLVEIDNNTRRASLIQKKTSEMDEYKKRVVSAASLIKEFEAMREEKSEELRAKTILLASSKSSLHKEEGQRLFEAIRKLTESKDQLMEDKDAAQKEELRLSSESAVLAHRIEERKNDQLKAKKLGEAIAGLEYQLVLHSKVFSAFGATGIPTLITHTVLDDFQIESNIILDKLRPGLRLQFLVEKEKKKGEEVAGDTLEITYFLNNIELEFAQLSGAQKVIASLALRLGLVAVIRNRIGVDLKMILIDEVDQSLDEGTLEAFEGIIRELRKDYKILVITHSNDVKAKFSHAILVEQDTELNSTAKVVAGGY